MIDMSMLYLKVVDEKGKPVNLKSLTSTGLEMIEHDLADMMQEVDELMSKKQR
jgi:hypothetical protein